MRSLNSSYNISFIVMVRFSAGRNQSTLRNPPIGHKYLTIPHKVTSSKLYPQSCTAKMTQYLKVMPTLNRSFTVLSCTQFTCQLTSLTRSFCYWSACTKSGEWVAVYLFVSGIILSLSTIFLWNFRNVPRLWYFRNVPRLWYFRNVPRLVFLFFHFITILTYIHDIVTYRTDI